MKDEEVLTEIGRFRAERVIRQNGESGLWAGRDLKLDRRAALMLISPRLVSPSTGEASKSTLRRLRELDLKHPNLVAIHEVGLEAEAPYVLMEYVEGTDVAQLIEGPHIPFIRKLEATVQACQALHCAHRAGITHGNLRPSSLRITKDWQVKVLYLGIPAAVTDTRVQRYQAPERLRGSPGDRRSDVFSLGVILFEWISGRHPFEAPLADDVAEGILNRRVSLSDALPDCSRELTDVVDQALAKSPGHRFANCGMFGQALQSFAERLPREVNRLKPMLLEARREWSDLQRRGVDTARVEGFFDESLTAPDPPGGDEDDYGHLLLRLRETKERSRLWALRRQQAEQIHQLLEQGRCRLNEGDYPGCFVAVDRVFHIHRDNPRAAELRDLCVQRAREEDEKRLCLRAALDLAKKACASGDFHRCLQRLDAALELDPNHRQALELRQEALDGLAEHLKAFARRAREFEECGDLDSALETVQAGLRILSNNANLLELESRLQRLSASRRHSAAERLEDVHRALGAGDHSRALKLADEAIELAPADPRAEEIWIEVARARLRSRKTERLARLSESFEALGDSRSAVEVARRGLAKEPEDRRLSVRLENAGAALRGESLGDDTVVRPLLEAARKAHGQEGRDRRRRLIQFALRLVPEHPQAGDLEKAAEPPAKTVSQPETSGYEGDKTEERAVHRWFWGWVTASGIAGLALLIAFTGRNFLEPPLPASGRLLLDPQPWAQLESLVRLDDGQEVELSNIQCSGSILDRPGTPCLLDLPSGRYQVHLRSPHFGVQEFEVTVEPERVEVWRHPLPDFDMEKEIDQELAGWDDPFPADDRPEH